MSPLRLSFAALALTTSGDPGIAFGTHDNLIWPHLGAGGRFAFNETITLTLRIGFPVSSVGVSLLL